MKLTELHNFAKMPYFSKNLIAKLLIVLSCLCLLECQNAKPTANAEIQSVPPVLTTQAPSARQAWIQMEKDLKSHIGKAIRRYMPFLMREIYKKEISSHCLSALMQVSGALKQGKLWPFKMLDSSGKILPDGFLSGTLTALGNYEECVDIDASNSKQEMKGQYCVIDMRPPIPAWRPYTSLHLAVPELVNISAPDTLITYMTGFIHNIHVVTMKSGLCVPHRCSLDDVNNLAQIVPELTGLTWNFSVSSCEMKNPVEFSPAQALALCLIGIMSFLVVIGTFIEQMWISDDFDQGGTKAAAFHFLKCFSFPVNGKRLASYSSPHENLNFVYGIMFFAFFWIVVANTFMYVNFDIASNFIEALTLVKSVFYEIMLNRVFPIQALLYLSGFTTAYMYLKSSDPNLNVLKFFIKRYLRYTPTYILVIATIILTPVFGSGPTWNKSMSPYHTNCRDNWWYNILFINNFVETRKMCLDHTWVFAVDAQLYLISLLILIPLKLRPTIGLLVNLVLGLASLLCVALTNVYYDLPPNEMSAYLHVKDRNSYAEHSYYRVYTHLSVYCTGIFIAHLMVKKPDLKISKMATWLLWAGTICAYFAALCVVHEWRLGTMPSPLTGALYSAFSKVAECTFLGWITVACMTGHAGGFKNVLGWRPFAFFARMTFIAFLIHVPLITIINAVKKVHVFVEEFEIFYLVLSYLAATFLMSYILHIFLEAPFLSLADVLRKRRQEKTFNTSESVGTSVMTEKPRRFSQKSQEKANGKSWTPTIERLNC